MDTPQCTAAALKLDGYVRHFRGMAAVRFAMAFGLSAIVGIVAGWPYAIGFGLLQLSLYGVLFWAVEVAARDPNQELACAS